ncbi:MAG: cytochrome c3 family protein [Deltaproteobacteria bacterium]|nr:cytochrome c3 family protein [Deltaproteobacteria bacterium]
MKRDFKISLIALFLCMGFFMTVPDGLLARQDFEMLKNRSANNSNVHGDFIRRGVACSACHYKRSNSEEEWICFFCHSAEHDGQVKSRRGRKKGAKMRQRVFDRFREKAKKLDVLSVYRKEYTHPTLSVGGVHRHWEEFGGNNEPPRHAECPDCHDPHEVSQWNKFGPIEVVKKTGLKEKLKNLRDMERGEAVRDYELCFKCHSDSVNLPVDQTNKRLDFDENNPSYHPVLAEGRNSIMPSLRDGYTESSIITCSDCHNNDDKNGPQGPHGSNYKFILKSRYSIEDGLAESPGDYALCYDCHKRSSILYNESFSLHEMHIKGNPVTGSRGTSCYTCHDAHGSREYAHLIRFNEEVVFQNPSTLEIKFVDGDQEGEGECSLMCHGVNHNPKAYKKGPAP